MSKIAMTDLAGIIGNVDVFLTSVSFEERCTSVATQAGFDERTLAQCFVTSELRGDDRTSINLNVLVHALPNFATPVFLENRAPVLVAERFRLTLDSLPLAAKNFLVDITSFTHEALLILFKALWEFRETRPYAVIRFIYTGAEEYSINEPIGSKWLSRGITDIRSVYGYPGVMYPSRRLHLIIMLGFEIERTVRLISAYEPARISIGIPENVSAVAPQHSDLSEMFAKELYNAYPSHSEFIFSAIDALQVAEVLKTVTSDSAEFNSVIAPMNTKISTIGAALAAVANPSIQLCYAPAAFYNTSGYSRPGDSFYLFSLAETTQTTLPVREISGSFA